MFSQYATLEMILGVVVLVGILYAIVRLNRRSQDEDDVLPKVDEIDGLGELSAKSETAQDVSMKELMEDGIVSPPKVIAPASAEAKVAALRAKVHQEKTKDVPTKSTAPISTVIAIHVMARGQRAFNGEDIANVMTQVGLHYGDLKVYHRYAEHNEQHGQILFSVASAVNPGTLPVHLGQQYTCPGLTFFLDFGKQKNAVTMFQMMLNTARTVAQSLDGELRDEQRKTWSLTAEQAIRRRIQQYFMQSMKNAASSSNHEADLLA